MKVQIFSLALLGLVLGHSQAALASGTEAGYLPKFTVEATGRPLNGFPLPLMSRETFFRDYTVDGYIFHGTPEPQTAEKIYQEGFRLSVHTHYGPGLYATYDPLIAWKYAAPRGQVLFVKIKDSLADRIHVLEWRSVEKDPWMIALKGRCEQEGRDLFEVLVRQYGIDVIVEDHVVIQNGAILETAPHSASAAEQHLRVVRNAALPLELRLTAALNLERARRFGAATFPTASPEDKLDLLKKLLKTDSFLSRYRNGRDDRLSALQPTEEVLTYFLPQVPEPVEYLKRLTANRSEDVRAAIVSLLHEEEWKYRPGIFEVLERLASTGDEELQSRVIHLLSTMESKRAPGGMDLIGRFVEEGWVHRKVAVALASSEWGGDPRAIKLVRIMAGLEPAASGRIFSPSQKDLEAFMTVLANSRMAQSPLDPAGGCLASELRGLLIR